MSLTQTAYVSVPGPSLSLPAKAQTVPDCRPCVHMSAVHVKVVSSLFVWVYLGKFGELSRPY